jgi:hypothetical protein
VRRWPQIRAGAIGLAIAFGMIDGCPLPEPNDTPAWERGFVEPIRSVQRIAEWPVAWIKPTLRVGQQWAVYQAPGANCYRLWIEGAEEGRAWRILYRGADPDHTEDADVLESSRVWGAWEPTDALPGQYKEIGNWILGRALARHPELRVTRMRLEKCALALGGFEPLGDFVFTIARVRGRP